MEDHGGPQPWPHTLLNATHSPDFKATGRCRVLCSQTPVNLQKILTELRTPSLAVPRAPVREPAASCCSSPTPPRALLLALVPSWEKMWPVVPALAR